MIGSEVWPPEPAQHPPVWRHPNKQVVFDIACGPGDSHGGRLGYSRWAAMPLPDAIELQTAGELVLGRDGSFDYEAVFDPAGGIEWHVNFADPHLGHDHLNWPHFRAL